MEKITIAYDFIFQMEVRKKNGKIYRNHYVNGIGAKYSSALWDVYFNCKRRKTIILKVIEVRVLGVAFAYNEAGFFKAKLSDYPPVIPDDLNAELKHLPQKG
nr:hypothetical protein [Pedobacter sp. ASV19]